MQKKDYEVRVYNIALKKVKNMKESDFISLKINYLKKQKLFALSKENNKVRENFRKV